MFTMAIGLRGQAQREGWMPTKTVRLAALLGTLILMSIAVNALTIVADAIFGSGLPALEIARRSRRRLTGWPATTSLRTGLHLIPSRAPTRPYSVVPSDKRA